MAAEELIALAKQTEEIRRWKLRELNRSGQERSGGVVQPSFEAPEPARVRGASVPFAPRARTAWHTQPPGQTLIVTSGLGGTRREDIPIKEA